VQNLTIKGVVRMMNVGCRIAVVALMCCGGALQAVGAEEDGTAAPLRLSGFWSIESGQTVGSWLIGSYVARQPLLRTYFNFGLSKQLSEQLQIHAFAEGKMYYNTFDKRNSNGVEAFQLPTMYYSFYFDRMDAVYSFGDTASPTLQFTVGYFPYSYNPDVRDLGAYLYRSGTYPAYLINDFDYPQARLAGVKVSSNLFGALHQDLLLTMETERVPYFDLNAGYIVSYNAGKIVTVGAGAMYRSLLPANSEYTSPQDFNNNGYLKNPVYDSIRGTYSGQTAYYTYAGLKLMGRFSFDPKRLIFGDTDDFGIFGSQDLKLYGEGAVLGVANYQASAGTSVNVYGYDTLKHKMPLMFGFNIPAFKVLDVLSAEFEWYGCTYPNNYEYIHESPIVPVPVTPQNEGCNSLDARNYAVADNWKWAVYTKKNFKSGLYLVGQVARDHIRNETPIASNIDREEALRTNQAWFWEIKAGYRF
jgi:hypothetical protein